MLAVEYWKPGHAPSCLCLLEPIWGETFPCSGNALLICFNVSVLLGKLKAGNLTRDKISFYFNLYQQETDE